jgi:phosphoglycolate phosphatase
MTKKITNKNPELIIFDWSGVISDDRRPVYEANMKLLEKHGKLTFSFEEWLPETVMSAVHFARKHHIEGSTEEITETYRKYLDEVITNGIKPQLIPGSDRTLRELKAKNKKIALLSSHPAENLEKEVDEFGLRKYFDFISGGVLDKVEVLREICGKLDKNYDDSAYVGDMISDVIAAKKLSLLAIAVTSGYHSKEVLEKEKPDYIIGSISEIINII